MNLDLIVKLTQEDLSFYHYPDPFQNRINSKFSKRACMTCYSPRPSGFHEWPCHYAIVDQVLNELEKLIPYVKKLEAALTEIRDDACSFNHCHEETDCTWLIAALALGDQNNENQ